MIHRLRVPDLSYHRVAIGCLGLITLAAAMKATLPTSGEDRFIYTGC